MLLLFYHAQQLSGVGVTPPVEPPVVEQTGQEIGNPGGPISGGTFSKGRWHDIKTKAAEARAKKRRHEEEVEAKEAALARVAAEIKTSAAAKQRASEDTTLAAKMRAFDLDAAVAIQQALQNVAIAKQRAEALALEEEEAAAALLLL